MKFGVEIECVFPVNNTYYESLKEQLALKCNGLGVRCVSEEYNHQTRQHWKIVYDRSLERSGYWPMEFVSPPMKKGEDAKRQIELICKVIKENGGVVNTDCGVHVHIDARSKSVEEVKQIIRRYALMEDKIDLLFPPSRRGNNNRYCFSIKDAVNTCANSINEIIYERYSKLNTQAYIRHGTLEFRQHHGTIDPTKIWNWVCFIEDFVKQCKTYDDYIVRRKEYPKFMEECGVKNRRLINSLVRIFSDQSVLGKKIENVIGSISREKTEIILKHINNSRSIWTPNRFIEPITLDTLLNDSNEPITLDTVLNDSNVKYISKILGIMSKLTPKIREVVDQEKSSESVKRMTTDELFTGISSELVEYYQRRMEEFETPRQRNNRTTTPTNQPIVELTNSVNSTWRMSFDQQP